jgi:hypothetical protein
MRCVECMASLLKLPTLRGRAGLDPRPCTPTQSRWHRTSRFTGYWPRSTDRQVEHVGACGVRELVVEPVSQVEDQVTNGSGLGKERVVARGEFNDVACSARELALCVGGRAVIVRTHQVGSRYVLPCC